MENFKSGLTKVSYVVGYIFGVLFVMTKRLFAL